MEIKITMYCLFKHKFPFKLEIYNAKIHINDVSRQESIMMQIFQIKNRSVKYKL